MVASTPEIPRARARGVSIDYFIKKITKMKEMFMLTYIVVTKLFNWSGVFIAQTVGIYGKTRLFARK